MSTTTLTLPLIAATLDGSGPFYAGRAVTGDVFWVSKPELPPTWQWADDADVTTEHVILDAPTVAELLFISTLEPDDGPTDALLCDVVTRQLERCHCNLKSCPLRSANEFGDHPELAVPRMLACLAWAARIVQTGAGA